MTSVMIAKGSAEIDRASVVIEAPSRSRELRSWPNDNTLLGRDRMAANQ